MAYHQQQVPCLLGIVAVSCSGFLCTAQAHIYASWGRTVQFATCHIIIMMMIGYQLELGVAWTDTSQTVWVFAGGVGIRYHSQGDC